MYSRPPPPHTHPASKRGAMVARRYCEVPVKSQARSQSCSQYMSTVPIHFPPSHTVGLEQPGTACNFVFGVWADKHWHEPGRPSKVWRPYWRAAPTVPSIWRWWPLPPSPLFLPPLFFPFHFSKSAPCHSLQGEGTLNSFILECFLFFSLFRLSLSFSSTAPRPPPLQPPK